MFKKPLFWFVVASVGVFIFRIPLILGPVFDNDEGIYATIGRYLFQGEVLYRDLWDNKLPAIYFFYGLITYIFHDPLYIRVIATLSLLTAAGLSFYLARKILTPSKAYVALFIFLLLLVLPILETFTSNAEVFFLPLSIAAITLTVLIEWFGWSRKWYLLVGFLIGVGILFKVVVLFDALAIATLLVTRHFYRIHKELFYLTVGGLISFTLPAYYIFKNGLVLLTYQAAFIGNIGYVAYGNALRFGPINLGSSNVVLAGKLLLVLIVIGFIKYSFRSTRSAVELLYIWFAWDLFSVFFSGHPYPHYLIQIIGVITIVLADQVGNIISMFKSGQFKAAHLAKLITLAGVTVAALILNFGGVYQSLGSSSELSRMVLGYSANGIQYLTGQISKDQFYSFYGEGALRNYKLSDKIKSLTSPSDKIFIWGNTPWIYFLSDRPHVSRFLVAYHVDLTKGARQEVLDQLRTDNPKIILWVKDEGNSSQNPPKFVEMEQFITTNYQLVDSTYHSSLYLLKK